MHEQTPEAQAREAVARVTLPSSYPQREGKKSVRHAESCLSQCAQSHKNKGKGQECNGIVMWARGEIEYLIDVIC